MPEEESYPLNSLTWRGHSSEFFKLKRPFFFSLKKRKVKKKGLFENKKIKNTYQIK